MHLTYRVEWEQSIDCWREFEKMVFRTLHQTKRFLKILFGFTLLGLGAVMVFTPGPGWLTIAFGLGILAAEYVWARRLLDQMKEQGLRLRGTLSAWVRTAGA